MSTGSRNGDEVIALLVCEREAQQESLSLTLADLRRLTKFRNAQIEDIDELGRQINYWSTKMGYGVRIQDMHVTSENVILPPGASRTRDHDEVDAGKRSRKPHKARHVESAISMLNEARKPLSANEIGDMMIQAGLSAVEDPKARRASIYAAMWRRGEIFCCYGRGLWGLREWDTTHKEQI